ncbi:hypothetical protein SAMN02745165_02326 [Malonomonas rubra DSM 5091]|uniref:DNA-binding protein n=1 Tax=Malonomonas rubra DSM 5091 TaxID=1122189 RepID=A0A1M6J758_MALRU|nr:hypothetical protein [Malonomonas rubra]SHJ42519.1 hypothetical protein SAMN02745165_02326 [Malonomonas rubra DSM 5091]
MKKTLNLIAISLAALVLVACSQDKPAQTASQTPGSATPPAMSAPAEQAPKAGGTSGTVVETMNAAGYTYVQVDSGTEKIWAAAPAFEVKVGDSVVVPDGMAMNNYHSKTLNRDFPVVYFVDSVLNASAPAAPTVASTDMPAGHPATNTAAPAPDVDLSNISKADGGLTVGEVYGDKANLSGKDIVLRGKVVKYSPQIMGKNWLHVQDGSGDQAAGTHDLTVTTNITAQIGDTVLVQGPLTVDKDFGYGYQYDVIIEDAKVTVE